MDKPIRIFRHVDCEGPGYLVDVLERNGLDFELIKVDRGEPVPPQINDVSALVFMGGSMSANDKLPWITEELDLVKRAIDKNIPVLGHCLGGQLMSKALGGVITQNPVKEFGWHKVTKQNNNAADEWLAEVPSSFDAYHWHGETFSLPPGTMPVLSSQYCPNQGFVIGNSLALQCHIEMTEDLVREWTNRFSDELAEPSKSIQSVEQQLDNLTDRTQNLQKAADSIYMRWLRPILES